MVVKVMLIYNSLKPIKLVETVISGKYAIWVIRELVDF